MTLSKEELEFALVCAKSYYYESSESDYPNKSDKNNEIRFRDLENALYADNLEIEGYEKSEWTKFDLDDPKTFPPNDTMVLYTCKGEVYYGDFTDVSKSSLFEVGTTFWRAKPNLPVEKELKNEVE